jgi:LPXTG-site transpeptidase (sortase) family protein
MKKFTIDSSRLAILGVALTVIGLIGVIPVLFNSDGAALAASNAAQTSDIGTPAQIAKAAPAAPTAPAAPQVISGHPIEIVAPSVNVDMPVVDGFYDPTTSGWTLNPDKAQFAAITTQPNDQSGQTFIYGHATQRVFGKLLNMHVGDQVSVLTSNGYKFTYTLKQTEVVTPSNTGILGYTGSPRLLLQTCVGAFSQDRKFFILDFTKVDKI